MGGEVCSLACVGKQVVLVHILRAQQHLCVDIVLGKERQHSVATCPQEGKESYTLLCKRTWNGFAERLIGDRTRKLGPREQRGTKTSHLNVESYD